MIKEGCQCFTCRHGDEPRLVSAYLTGYVEACDWFLNWAKRNNIKSGFIGDDDLEGIVAEMEYNRMASACYLQECPNIEEE